MWSQNKISVGRYVRIELDRFQDRAAVKQDRRKLIRQNTFRMASEKQTVLITGYE